MPEAPDTQPPVQSQEPKHRKCKGGEAGDTCAAFETNGICLANKARNK